MGRNIKDDIKLHGATNKDFAKDQGISEDRISAMLKDPENAPLGRVISCYNYMGADPSGMIEELSENRFADDGIFQFENGLSDTRERIKSVIMKCEYDLSKNRSVLDAIDEVYRYPLILIIGEYGSGKSTMAENLIGKKLYLLGNPMDRVYDHLLLISDKRGEVEYNYPFGEYPYKIKSKELLSELIRDSIIRENYIDQMIPAAKLGKDESNSSYEAFDYVVYSDSPALNELNILCLCNDHLNTTPEKNSGEGSEEIDINITSKANVIIILLGNTIDSDYMLANVLKLGWERWGKDITEHIIFAIPKCDQLYDTEEFELAKNHYIEIIQDHFKQIIPCGDKNREKILEDVCDSIYSYSSIYKKNNHKRKIDAENNVEFYQKLNRILASIPNDVERNKNILSENLIKLKESLHRQKEMTREQASQDILKVNKLVADAKKEFEEHFSMGYQNLISVESISEIISQNKISRNKEGRNRLVYIVNSKLTDLVKDTTEGVNNRLQAKIVTDKSISSEVREEFLIYSIPQEDYTPSFNAKSQDNSNDSLQKNASKAKNLGTVAMGLLFAPVIIAVATTAAAAAAVGATAVAVGDASGVVKSYYAQTNFEKNMSKKLVSAYNSNNVKEIILRKMTNYYESLKRDFCKTINSCVTRDEAEAESFIDKILNQL